MGTWDNKLVGVPYRVTMGILHYQPAVLKEAGIDKPPTTWAELQTAAIAVTKAGEGKRYGIGFCMRQGPAITDHWVTFLRSNGGKFFDPKTNEIFINNAAAVESLQFYGDLLTKYKVVPPDAVTWEWDEIIANGQNDRYGMTMTLAPSGTMLNDPKVSKTGGKWAWSVVPGAHTPDQSGTFLGGWSLGVSKYSKNKEWAFAFLQMVAGRDWGRQSMDRGNCTAHSSALNDPEIAKRIGWTPSAAQALKTAIVDPQEPIYGALELALRSGISKVLLGQADAKRFARFGGSELAAHHAPRRGALGDHPRHADQSSRRDRLRRPPLGADDQGFAALYERLLAGNLHRPRPRWLHARQLPGQRADQLPGRLQPPKDGKPGTDFPQFQAQALDAFDAQYAICNTLYGGAVAVSETMGAAMCSAVNDWVAKEWLDRDPRLRASIVVPAQSPHLAVEEIERMAGDSRFVQILLPVGLEMMLGRRYYWPLYRGRPAA